jgi:hypothetical protein
VSQAQEPGAIRPSIPRPTCPTCSGPMWLATILPADPDHEQCIFECVLCGLEIAKLMKLD